MHIFVDGKEKSNISLQNENSKTSRWNKPGYQRGGGGGYGWNRWRGVSPSLLTAEIHEVVHLIIWHCISYTGIKNKISIGRNDTLDLTDQNSIVESVIFCLWVQEVNWSQIKMGRCRTSGTRQAVCWWRLPPYQLLEVPHFKILDYRPTGTCS